MTDHTTAVLREAAERTRAIAVAMIEGAAEIHDRNADWRDGMEEAADLVRELPPDLIATRIARGGGEGA